MSKKIIAETTEGWEERARINYAKNALFELCDYCNVSTDLVGMMVVDLKGMGFFTAPAAAHHHSNYSGGLFDHSLAVTERLLSITDGMKLKWTRNASPIIIGMLHDLCKADQYESTSTGYKYNDGTLYSGHGDKSVLLACSIFKLTEEEIACIRYHMGAFTDKEEWKYYTKAVQTYPNVLWTHTADMVASQIMGV